MKQKKFQDRHQSRLTDFKNSVLDDGNCETIVLFNQTNAYRRNTAILDTAIFKTQIKTEGSNWELLVIRRLRDMNIENIAPILTSSGFGMMGGFLMGFAIKKVMKVLAIIAGIFLSVLAYFESQDIIYINWKNLQSVSENTSSQVVNVISEYNNPLHLHWI
jgi:uncharacterized membrane protein (Fun14 family)